MTNYATELGGSALRAAAALPSTNCLVTAVETHTADLLEGAGKLFGFAVTNVGRDRAVGFTYLDVFVEPTIHGFDAKLHEPISVTEDHILAFGMVEVGERAYHADTLVYDPQSGDDSAVRVLASSSYRRLALCANVFEVVAIAKGSSVEKSARSLLAETGADVVVSKAGARGCLVTQKNSQEWVGAAPTDQVRKLGSGDIFSAAFASSWSSGADAVEAARVASFATSWWADGFADRIPSELLSGVASSQVGRELENRGRRPRIYLAGPFFNVAERWLIEQCRTFLEQAGADVFSPVDEIGVGGPEVAKQDLDGLDGCDAVFAILDGWDSGTLFEAGWAKRKGIPLVGVASRFDGINETMLAGTGAELHTDYTTAMYRAIWRGLGGSPPVLTRR